MDRNGENLVVQILRLCAHLGTRVAEFLRAHWGWAIAGILVVLVAVQCWEMVRDYRRREIVFLASNPGSPSAQDAKLIERQLEKPASGFGGPFRSLFDQPYNVTVEGTSGYEDNRRRISRDQTGDVVGFAYDGFGDSENVTTIIPLDKRYLHILCRKEFIAKVNAREVKEPPSPEVDSDLEVPIAKSEANAGKETSSTEMGADLAVEAGISFGKLRKRLGKDPYKLLKAGRVRVGPDGSATYLCAKTVLEHFGLDAEKLNCTWVETTDDTRAALNRGDIDLAFVSSKFNSSKVREIASDGKCVLIGLDDDRDAIRQDHPELVPVEFQKNSYLSGDFCPKELKTIGARRVLVCSNHMSERDAYMVGMSTAQAFRDRMPEIEWRNTPPGVEEVQSTPLRFRLHPGAELIRYDRQPSGWPGGFSVILLTAVLWLSAEALRSVNSMLERGATDEDESATLSDEEVSEPEAPAETSQENEYDSIHREIEESLAKLQETPIPMSKRAYDRWERTIRSLEQRILESNREGSLTPKQTHQLMMGVKRELRWEHTVCRPPSVKQEA
jgi:hypothetical protein